MVLFKVGLEGCGAGVMLVSKSRASAESHVIIIFVNSCLSPPHTQENQSDTTKQERTANTTDNTADDVLIGLAQTTSTVATALCSGGLCNDSCTGSEERC